MSFEVIKQKLLRLQPDASFDPPEILNRYFNPAFSALFLAHAVEHPNAAMVPHRIHGEPSQCHRTAALYASTHPDVIPFWGFVLTDEACFNGWRYWCHSRCVDRDFTVRYENEPSLSLGQRFIGISYCREMFHALDKDPDSDSSYIPPIFNHSVFDLPIPEGGRNWAM